MILYSHNAVRPLRIDWPRKYISQHNKNEIIFTSQLKQTSKTHNLTEFNWICQHPWISTPHVHFTFPQYLYFTTTVWCFFSSINICENIFRVEENGSVTLTKFKYSIPKKCTSSHILYFYNSLCFFRHTTESVVLINHRTRRGSNQFNDYLSCTIDSFALATTKYQISNNWVPKSVLKNWTKRLLPPHCFFILLNFNSKKIQLFSASDFKILWTPS